MKPDWRPIAEHPLLSDCLANDSLRNSGPPRVLVWGKKIGVVPGKVYNYGCGGDLGVSAQADGYYGEWEITHFAPWPEGPDHE